MWHPLNKSKIICKITLSVQFSCSVVSDSLWPHGLQHTRPPCLSPTPGVYSDSCRLSRWCHPTISSSVIPFSSHLQFFPALGSFPMSQLFTSDGQSTGVSASSVLPMNIQDFDSISPSLGSSVVCFDMGLFMCDVEGSFLLLLTCSGSSFYP